VSAEISDDEENNGVFDAVEKPTTQAQELI